jgi:predicted outer membrane repeat protein
VGPLGTHPPELTLSNVTVSGNTATGQGGGLYNDGAADPAGDGGILICRNCTISDNHAPIGGGVAFAAARPGTARFADSVIGGNSASASPDCDGELTSQGHNLIQDTTGCAVTGDTTGNIAGAEPGLGPLADNGGPTRTHALRPDSPAVDAGGDPCLAVDQRGVPRPQDGDGDGLATCDIGAYEYRRRVVAIQIDIKPDSHPNTTNPRSGGVIPVVVFGSDALDVGAIDPTTLSFGPGAARIAHLRGHAQDVDGDAIVDLVLHFRTRDVGIGCADEPIVLHLTGETVDGRAFEGVDSIRTVGCRGESRPGARTEDEARGTAPSTGRKLAIRGR